jgi:phosphomannomutase
MPQFPEEIFRAYDIRGTEDQLSDELAKRTALALVKVTGARRVVLGRDMRPSSPRLASSAGQAFISAGVDVVDIGLCTTSLFNFAVAHFSEHEAGLMVTASHNPAAYNGIKTASGDGSPISGEQLKPLVMKETFLEKSKNGKSGEAKSLNFVQPYLDYCFEKAGRLTTGSLKPLQVVVDAGNGVGAVTLVPLFERLKAFHVRMTPLFFEPDGAFPNHEANPVKEETLKALKRRIKEEKADLGIALDGDGDRVGFVDERGEFIRGDILLALLAAERITSRRQQDSSPCLVPPRVVFCPNASWAVNDAVKAAGGVPLHAKVGRTIAKKMKEVGAVLGGEPSCHFYYDDFHYLESVDYTILLVLKRLLLSQLPLSQIIAPHRMYATTGEINVPFTGDKAGILRVFEERYRPLSRLQSNLDGWRFEFDGWWFNIRPSNTEPLMRLTIEAKTPEVLEEKRRELTAILPH